MIERQNRTLICSVLFVDIVEYSLQPVVEQIKFKDRLNALLAEVLKDVAVNDRVVLDTGDGAAISFLGDPEDALFAALSLRDGAAAQTEAHDEPALMLRMGVNLGPVKLVRDLNGQRNIIGDGINVAQRVMSYCVPGQVLVSRSYFEVVSRLSEEFARLFQYEGARTDKHVREHEIYAVVGGGGAELKRAASESAHHRSKDRADLVAAGRMTRFGVAVGSALRSGTRLAVGLVVLIVLGALTALVLHRSQPNVASVKPQSPAPSARSLTGMESHAVEPPHSQDKIAPAVAEPKAVQARAPTRVSVERPAVLRFAITPWGEIYIDGKKRGASPPLREVKVPPGKHEVEIRNSAFPSHIASIDVKPGARMDIKYIFQ